jgi:hypothetical protein
MVRGQPSQKQKFMRPYFNKWLGLVVCTCHLSYLEDSGPGWPKNKQPLQKTQNSQIILFLCFIPLEPHSWQFLLLSYFTGRLSNFCQLQTSILLPMASCE